jgi:hypothetical protein
MFHPFIASAITAHTRARIHSLEHQTHAMHTATDGLFCAPGELARVRRTHRVTNRAEKLGDLTHESHGDLLLVRNKCYILYGDGPRTDARLPGSAIPGKHFAKFALHGFHGNVRELERLALSGERRYTRLRANTLKQSLQRGEHFNDFVERPFTLKVGPIPQR